MERAVIVVDGVVQGVGFRWWTQSVARELGLVGSAENLTDGSVRVVAQGESAAVSRLVEALTAQPPRRGRPGRVSAHSIEWTAAQPGITGFSVR